MVEEQLMGVLTIVDAENSVRWNWEIVQDVSKRISKLAISLDHYVRLRAATQDAISGRNEPFIDEFEMVGRIEREAMQLMWKRMPPVKPGQYRMFFEVLASPVDYSAGEVLVKDLNPLRRPPLDVSLPESHDAEEGIRIFRLLRGIWALPEVIDGIFAAFVWEMSWPHLDEHKCTFNEMLTEMYHWFDSPGRSQHDTYYIEK